MSTLLPELVDLRPSEQAMQTFLEQSDKFISDVARGIFQQNKDLCLRLGLDTDDLAQMGRIKLWMQADAYDASRGTSYKAFCKTIMSHAMIDGIRHEYAVRKLEMECGVDLDGSETGEEIYSSYAPCQYEPPESICLRRETLKELKTALEQISDRDRTYLTYRFGLKNGESHSLEDSARYFHLKKNLGKRAEKEALKHLRENMP